MTIPTFIGCALIAFSPAVLFYALVVMRSHKLTVLSIGAGFFWVASVCLASILWYIIKPLRLIYPQITVIVAVILSEASRWLFWVVWTKGQESLMQRTGDNVSQGTKLGEAVASGLGIGLTYSLVMYAGVLWEALGPATLMSKSCPTASVFAISAILAMAWTILHTLWAIVAFHGYYEKSKWRVGLVFISHLILSLFTTIN